MASPLWYTPRVSIYRAATHNGCAPDRTQNMPIRPATTASDERTTDQRRVKTLHRNTGTATWGFIIASPSKSPPEIGRRTAISIATIEHTSAIN